MGKIASKISDIGAPIVIGLSGSLSMSLIAYLLQNEKLPLWMISQHKTVNLTFTMQMIMLPLSFIASALMYLYNRKNFKTFFRIGVSDKNNQWKLYGPAIAVSFTAGTTLLMSVGVTAQNGSVNNSFYALLPLVLLFSATNLRMLPGDDHRTGAKYDKVL